MLLGWCLSLNCSNTAFGPFHFLPMNLGQRMVAFWVLETKSRAYPHIGQLQLILLVTLPEDYSQASVCQCFDRAEQHEQVTPRDLWADLLFAAGHQPINKASCGLEQSFVMDHFSPCAPLQCPSSELNACAGNAPAARLWNEGWCFKQGITRWLLLAGRVA